MWEMRNGCSILAGKHKGKRLLGRSKSRWEDKKIDFKKQD
jgi:hypothetical protein